jgi:hypothetical protein
VPGSAVGAVADDARVFEDVNASSC